jgi:hypothetical protein
MLQVYVFRCFIQYIALKCFMSHAFHVIRRVRVAGIDGDVARVPGMGRDELGADGRGAWRASVLRTGHDGSGANGLESSLTWRAGHARRVIWIPRGGGHVRARKKLQTGQAAQACGLVSASIAADLANRSTDGTLETQSTLLSTAVEPQSTIHTHIKHLKFESTALMSQ